MKVATGSYTGNGTTQTISCGFEPTVVYVRGGAQSSAVWCKETWNERTNSFDALLSRGSGITARDDGFDIRDLAFVNASGTTFHWCAIADDGTLALESLNWQGNGLSPHRIKLNTQKTPKAVQIKRDTAAESVGRSFDSTSSVNLTGSGAVVGQLVLSAGLGYIDVDGNNKVNQLSGTLGEATMGHFFFGDYNSAVVTWTGDGVAGRVIPTGLSSALKFATIFADAAFIMRYKSDTMAAGETHPVTPIAAKSNEVSFTGSTIVIGSDTACNASGVVYHAVVFAADNGVPLPRTPRVTTCKPGSGRKVVSLPGRSVLSAIDCGVSDSLMITGAMTQEWLGQLFYADMNATGASTCGGLMLRHSGDLATSGNVSWGLLATHTDDTYGSSSPFINPIVSPLFINIDANVNDVGKIMRSGVLPPRFHRWMHVIVTHDGLGNVEMWMNGHRTKHRNIDATTRGTTNIVSTPGHKTVVGARWDGAAFVDALRMNFALGRVWTRELTYAECIARYRRAALGDTSAADVTGFLEEWDAANASGTSLPATVNAANNGTIVNGSIVTL